jgi:Subtilase family
MFGEGKIMHYFRVRSRGLSISAIVALGLGASMHAASQGPVPDNIGGGLRQLIEAHGNAAAAPSALSAAASLEPRLLRDTQSRVLVNVWLDGGRSLADVRQALADLGANVHSELSNYRKGVIAAYVPVERASDAARLTGVRSVTLEHKPQLRLGKATSQGVATVHADKLNARGLTGQGMTIGILSDSFNKAPNSATTDHAAQDIRSGDLPGRGNPFGDTTPIVVLDEDPVAGTDEGRALMQIVYDIAPDAKLCFATAFTGEVQFAANILKLADPKGKCKADVIDDDVGYSQEPFFSDGVVALAVDQVKADGVAYFSSAGNDNSGNYSATFNPISDGDARANFAGPLVLGNVPTELTAGGWHNFGAKNVSISMPIFASAGANHFLVLQWDDPFFDITPTASYDFLVFDDNGFYHPELSGIDNVYSTGQPVQGLVLPGGDPNQVSGLVWFVAIALRGPGFATPHAMHLKMVDFDDGNQVTLLRFAQPLAPSVFGHPAAAGAIAVAADFWDNTASTEYFSSLGPTAIYFDQDNVRLARAEIRKKPEIAAPDGVDTTFFGQQGAPTDPNPVFLGTSAAAPHAAAVGALLIQAAGGPGKLPPDELKTLLEETTQQPHQLTAGEVSAKLVSGTDKVTVIVKGFLPLDPTQFTFEFSGPPGDSVKSIVMDATRANISFGDSADQFLIGSTNVPQGDIVYLNHNGLSPVARLEFLHQGFTNNHFLQLGFDFDNPLVGFLGINSSLLFGTRVTATIQSGNTTKTVSGVLSAPTGRGFAVSDGFGLIDAFAAFEKLKGSAAAVK